MQIRFHAQIISYQVSGRINHNRGVRGVTRVVYFGQMGQKTYEKHAVELRMRFHTVQRGIVYRFQSVHARVKDKRIKWLDGGKKKVIIDQTSEKIRTGGLGSRLRFKVGKERWLLWRYDVEVAVFAAFFALFFSFFVFVLVFVVFVFFVVVFFVIIVVFVVDLVVVVTYYFDLLFVFAFFFVALFFVVVFVFFAAFFLVASFVFAE